MLLTLEPAVSLVPFGAVLLIGCAFILDFICAAMVINAFSTFVAFFAEVSRNSIPSESANSYKIKKIKIIRY